jgi:hypothetical protein
VTVAALVDSATVAVPAAGEAEGSRGAAAALACAGADLDRATLLVDIGGRAPRPTLLTAAAAQALETRLAAHLADARVAARGQVCHLAVSPEPVGLETAAAALTVARGALAVLHVPPGYLQALLEHEIGSRLTGALLRADLAADRALAALAIGDLLDRGLDVKVLKRRLSWVAERRALFGALDSDAAGGLPRSLRTGLLSHECYAGANAPRVDPTRATQPERRDHAGIGSR